MYTVKFPFWLTLFGALSLTACEKTPAPPKEDSAYWGTVSASKNGKNWVGSPYAFVNINLGIDSIVNLSFDSLDMYGIHREECSIIKVPLTPDKYSVVANTAINKKDGLIGAHFFYTEEDVLYGAYKILNDSTSYVTIQTYDAATKELTGNFDLTFIVDKRPYAGAPDTIRLKNGVFHTRVIKI